jgi:hypothetical protein
MATHLGSSTKARALGRLAPTGLAIAAALVTAFGCDPPSEPGSSSSADGGPGAEETAPADVVGATDAEAAEAAEAAETTPPPDAGAPPDAGDAATVPIEPPSCDVELVPDPAAEANAKADLAALAPLATLSFASTRGTLEHISNMSVTISSCAAGDVPPGEGLAALLKAHPALFQMDPAEWDAAFPSCTSPLASEWLTWNRLLYGQHPVRRDAVAMHFTRTMSGIVLDAVHGTYLPMASPATDAAMGACPKLDAAKAEVIARSTKHHYTVFDHCVALSSGDYVPAPADAFAPLERYWEWAEAGGAVRFDSLQRAALRVAPGSYTPDLLASDANCFASGQNNVAFTLLYDAAKSSLLESHPGEGCVVCLAGRE